MFYKTESGDGKTSSTHGIRFCTSGKSMWKVSLTQFFWTAFWISIGKGCLYQYTYQPPSALLCNPYIDNALYLECAINGPNLQQIQWFFENETDIYELKNNDKYLIANVSTDAARFTSRLTVNGFEDNSDAGMYWCTGVLDDGSTLQTFSSELSIEIEEYYSDLRRCPKNLFLKKSETKCINIAISDPPQTTMEDGTLSSVTSTAKQLSANGTGLEMSTVTELVASPSPWAFNYILIGVLSLVALLFIICIVLMIVIGLQCRRRQKMKSFHETSGEFLRSVTQSTESEFNRKDASGEYAEIGPAIIATVAQHMTENPHYSSINGSMLKPPPPCTNPVMQHLEYPDGCHMVENPYDAPTSPNEADNNQNDVEKYSRLDRVVPCVGVPTMEKRTSMCVDAQMDIPNQNNNSFTKVSGTTVDENNVNPEHPYYILEEPKDTTEASDTESWSSGSCHGICLPKDATISFENHHGSMSSPTDDERYQTSDNFNTHDASKHTYDHLESRDLANSHESKYQNIQQYLEPISLKVNMHVDGNANSNCNENSGTTPKYSGDYERDPMYLEKMQSSASSSPAPHYQTLAESTMDPPDNYTQLQAFSKS